MTTPYVLQPGGGRRFRNPVGGDLVFKLEGSRSGNATNVLETGAAPGEGPPLHFHEGQDEWLYVLSGTSRFRLDDGGRGAAARTVASDARRSRLMAVAELEGFIAAYHRALDAFFRGDREPAKSMYAHTAEARSSSQGIAGDECS
jgi:hypothetical protein